MHHVRHPAVFTFALIFATLLAVVGFAPRASANGSPSEFDYPELLAWPSTPETIGPSSFVGNEE